MTDFTLDVKSREEGVKPKFLISQGKVPGVVYGHNIKNQNIVLDVKQLNKIYDEAGESSLINLKIDDVKPIKVMIKEIQREPLRDKMIHVDFRKVRMDQKIRAEVDLEFVGEAPAVKELGGTLVKNFGYLEIECLPNDLVSEIKVDLSKLATFEDTIRIKDLPIPESVKVMQDAERTIAVVQPPMTEEEIAALEKAPEEAIEEVEVEAKGKEEAAEEGAEEKKGETKGKEGEAKEEAKKSS